jgi:hypothetical protein
VLLYVSCSWVRSLHSHAVSPKIVPLAGSVISRDAFEGSEKTDHIQSSLGEGGREDGERARASEASYWIPIKMGHVSGR